MTQKIFGARVWTALIVVLLVCPAAWAGSPNGRYAALVIDPDADRILYSRNADKLRHPASLTKMMTLFMLFEALDRRELALSDRLWVSKHAYGQAPSKLGLKPGQSITVEEAILGLVTKSANDVAVVVAEALGGTEWTFAKKMTARARELGMRNTTFRNASGLHHRSQVTTARDMARLARRLQLEFPRFYSYFSVARFQYRDRSYRNHNRLLVDYQGTDGIKTGYIRASGFNLVASVKRGDHRLIAVVFGGRTAKSRDHHITELLNTGFARLRSDPDTASAAQGNARSIPGGQRVDSLSLVPAGGASPCIGARIQASGHTDLPPCPG